MKALYWIIGISKSYMQVYLYLCILNSYVNDKINSYSSPWLCLQWHLRQKQTLLALIWGTLHSNLDRISLAPPQPHPLVSGRGPTVIVDQSLHVRQVRFGAGIRRPQKNIPDRYLQKSKHATDTDIRRRWVWWAWLTLDEGQWVPSLTTGLATSCCCLSTHNFCIGTACWLKDGWLAARQRATAR